MKKTLLLATFAVLACTAPAFAAAAPHAGDVAPAMSLPKTTGGTLSLASLKGKAVYLNFFASWCGPCNEEAPSIAALQRKYKSKGLVVVGIDEQEDASKAKGFLAKYKLPYSAVTDADGSEGRAYGVLALPVHVFIDRNGKVSTYRLGEMNPGEIEAAIKKTL
ncbi:MAG: TlpA disulfide reductase family protein [Candidatus Baltobacteraceae bacterium]|jgi:peroxiredoxin